MSRVPPHNLEAEESLLGAMLLSRDAIRPGLDLVEGPDDFYKPAHARLFEAIEVLHHRGAPVDVTSVAEELRRRGVDTDSNVLLRLQAATPASANAWHYATIVAELAMLRRAITAAGEIAEAAYDGELDGLERVLTATPGRVFGDRSTKALEPGMEASEFASQHFEERWVIPNLVAKGDQIILVGAEGWGKSVLCRQIGVMHASALHPFTGFELGGPGRVLVVDLENPPPKVAKSLRALLARAGDRYGGTMWLRCRPQGLDLRRPRDARWLDRLCVHHRPDLLVIGPLSKCYRGAEGSGKYSEEAATETASVFDELRVRHDCALLIEAHAPHGESGDRAGWRPRGSSYWMSWPAVGLGMKPVDRGTVELVHWRGARDRDTGKVWPSKLVEGHRDAWPWVVPLEELEEIA